MGFQIIKNRVLKMEKSFDYHNFSYLCFLVKLSRELSPEQVKHYKNWLQARNISHDVKFTEKQLSRTMDKFDSSRC